MAKLVSVVQGLPNGMLIKLTSQLLVALAILLSAQLFPSQVLVAIANPLLVIILADKLLVIVLADPLVVMLANPLKVLPTNQLMAMSANCT